MTRFCLFAMLLTASFVAAQVRAETPAVRIPQASAAPPAAPNRPVENKQRMREGAKLNDAVGRFEFSGDRLAFYPNDGGEPLKAIENLSLERIAQAVQESRTKVEWIVSGTVTEFRGANYLLVTRAVTRALEAGRTGQ